MESDKEEPCMKIVNTEEFNALMNEDAVLVDFFATWCGPCKMLTPVLESVANKLDGKVKIVKVDVDESPDLAQRFGIMSVPTMILFKKGQQAGIAINWNSGVVYDPAKKIDPYLVRSSFSAHGKGFQSDTKKIDETLKFLDYTNQLQAYCFVPSCTESQERRKSIPIPCADYTPNAG